MRLFVFLIQNYLEEKMIDEKLFRQDIDLVAQKLATRGFTLDKSKYSNLENKRKEQQAELERLQSLRNANSKKIGELKRKGEDVAHIFKAMEQIGLDLEKATGAFNQVRKELDDFFLSLPNLPHFSVPQGKSEAENVEIRRWGEPKKFDFEVKDHTDLGAREQMLDFEWASKLSGSRFAVMRKNLARLHRSLGQFMLNVQTQDHDYEECWTPIIVEQKSLYGTGQLPKFAEDLFKLDLAGEQDFYMIPTAEVTLTNYAQNKILAGEELPKKLTALTNCFRSEAGSYGQDTRGIIRQHQFEKVEMVQLTDAETSYDALEEMVTNAEAILQKLGLPYRVIVLCTGDMGFAASKTYDIEVWLPSQNKYREISSISNCEAFQARRMQARYKSKTDKKPQLLHTLNGSGLAVGRTLVALMENYQEAGGRIKIPEVLAPYMSGLEYI